MIARRLLLLFALTSAPVFADDTPIERTGLAFDKESGAWSFNWWGVNSRTYFIQHSETLTSWTFLPVIEQGTDAPLSYGFWLDPQPPRLFLRLKGQDSTAADPYTADFDGDGIPNGWEIEHGLDPFNTSDASASTGGHTNLEMYLQSLDEGADPLFTNALGFSFHSP